MRSISSLTSKRLLTSVLIFSTLTLSTNIQAGKFYKWVDESGATHYTETPPPNTQSTTVRTQGQDPKNAEQAQAKLSEQRKTFAEAIADKQEASKKSAVEAENEKIKKTNCDTAKNNLKMLEEHSRIREKGENGEYVVIGEEQRQAKIQTAKQNIKEFCN